MQISAEKIKIPVVFHNLKGYDSHFINTAKGLILEVDLEYPPELHDLHNDYPLAPEKMVVREENALKVFSRNSR